MEPDLDTSDLWKIWSWDEKVRCYYCNRLYVFHCVFLKWTQLQHRKLSLKKLFQRMIDWQFEKVRNEPDKALTEDNRAIQDEDIQRYVHQNTVNRIFHHLKFHVLSRRPILFRGEVLLLQ